MIDYRLLSSQKIGLLVACLLFAFSCNNQPQKPTTIIFGGDILLDRGVEVQIEKNGMPSIVDSIKPLLRECDYAVANLECPITNISAPINKQFVFKGSPQHIAYLRDAGLTHLVLANNHSMDQGRKGLVSTNANLTAIDLIPIGYGTSQSAACEPTIIENDEHTIAIFSSVQLKLENWMYLEDKAGVCQASINDLCSSIKLYSSENPNGIVFVNLHWGEEYSQKADYGQQQDAQFLLDAGADAIFGHHPHVVQNIEYYKSKPIFYSLGNFIFDQSKPYTDLGVLAKCVVHSKHDIEYEVHPFKIDMCVPISLSAGYKLDSIQSHLTDLSPTVEFEKEEGYLKISNSKPTQ